MCKLTHRYRGQAPSHIDGIGGMPDRAIGRPGPVAICQKRHAAGNASLGLCPLSPAFPAAATRPQDHRLTIVGGGLPPIAVCQPRHVQADPPLSGASRTVAPPLPHLFCALMGLAACLIAPLAGLVLLRYVKNATPPAMRRWAYALYPLHFLLLLLVRKIIA